MNLVTQAAFARLVGRSKSAVNKAVKKGILVKCFKDGKIDLDTNAVQVFNEYSSGSKHEYDEPPQTSVALDREIKLEGKYKQLEEIEKEYNELLSKPGSITVNTSTQILERIWKIKNQIRVHEVAMGELIYLDEAKTIVNNVFSPIDQYLNDMPDTLKSHFPEIPNDVIKWLRDNNNKLKVVTHKRMIKSE